MKVLFFSTHSYDTKFFKAIEKPSDFDFTFERSGLSPLSAAIAEGYDAICIFVNDHCNAQVIEILHAHGVKAIFLRCAGFDNVDCVRAKELGIFVARVPGISPLRGRTD
jgi:D-lactate dehydrogenase